MNFLKKGLMKKAAKKMQENMPSLKDFAVQNDQGYNALVKVMKEINNRRKKAHKYIVPID